MGECVLPEVDVIAAALEVADESAGLREAG
jgi:hypothetical protein